MAITATPDFSKLVRNSRRTAMKAAQRHTRIVRALRVALPVCGAVVLAGIIAAIMLDERAILAEVDAESFGITGTKIIMEWPKFSGSQLNSAGQAKGYEVLASRAEQRIAKPDEIDLFEIKGKMEIRQNGWVELMASSGHFNKKDQILDLVQSIQVTTDVGDRLDLAEARVNFAKGEIISGKPVSIKFQRADLNAAGMHLFDVGNRAVFTGNVVMTLKPDPDAPVESHGIEGLR